MRCTAGLGCVAHDATAEAMLAVVLLRAPYEDRPWGWTRNEISLIVIDLESPLTAPRVLTIRACLPPQSVFYSLGESMYTAGCVSRLCF